jgi:tRNA-specific 2-thiouridylase
MGPSGRELHRGVDPAKDQSYVLGVLTAAQLATALLPLGGSTKPQVRAEAAARGLAVAGKPDSHDICFVRDGDTAGFLRGRLGEVPGEIRDESGAVVGRHSGAYAFTVGQRRGLRLDRAPGDGRRRYVLDVSPAARTVTVGPAEALEVREVAGSAPRWCGDEPAPRFAAAAQYRAHGAAVPAVVHRTGRVVRVRFEQPQRGVAPGQAVVLYDGSRVIGSVTVDRTAA